MNDKISLSLNWLAQSLQDICAETIIKNNINKTLLPITILNDIAKKELNHNVLIRVPKLDEIPCVFKYLQICLGNIEQSYFTQKLLFCDNIFDFIILNLDKIIPYVKLLETIIDKLHELKQGKCYKNHANYYLEKIQEKLII